MKTSVYKQIRNTVYKQTKRQRQEHAVDYFGCSLLHLQEKKENGLSTSKMVSQKHPLFLLAGFFPRCHTARRGCAVVEVMEFIIYCVVPCLSGQWSCCISLSCLLRVCGALGIMRNALIGCPVTCWQCVICELVCAAVLLNACENLLLTTMVCVEAGLQWYVLMLA